MFPILSHIDWECLGEQSDAVCECPVYVRVSFFFFFKDHLLLKNCSCSAILGAKNVYLRSEKKKGSPQYVECLQRLLMGVRFFSFFFFFHCGISRCFHLPFGWASLLWCTSRRFSGLLHKAFRMFFFFLLIPLRQSLPTELFIQFSFLSSVQSPPFFLISRQVYCVCCGSPRHCLRETAPFDSKAVMKRHRRHVLGLARD